MFRNIDLTDFGLGLVTAHADVKLEDGAASDVLGFECLEDRLRLSGGGQQVGSDSVTGSVSNTFSATKTDGTLVIWKKVGTKLYVKDGSAAWAEVGSSLFAGASSDIPSFDLWESFNGAWVFFSSPNSALWKVPVANPASAIKFVSAGYKGQLKIIKSRLNVWGWPTSGGAKDVSGVQTGYLPPADIGHAHYTAVTNEVIGTGNGATITFSNTLAAVSGTRNVFAVSVTDGVETFTDNGSGTLSGSAGGTGTVNYATGAISVTFAVAVVNLTTVKANYTWEDDGASGGLAYFTTLSTAAGDGKAHYLSQATGGPLKTAYEFNDAAYFVHERAVWRVTYDAYGDPSTNLVWRAGSGCSGVLSSIPTSDGIYFVDDSDPNKPNVRVITLDRKNTASVICPSVTDDKLDLTGWTLGAMGRHDDRILVAATDPVGNHRTLVLTRRKGSWSVMPYAASCFANYGSQSAYGELASGLVFTAFDGTDADGFTPENNWTGGASKLGYDGLKRCRELELEGLIDPAQSFTVEAANDGGEFSALGTVYGNGTYVISSDTGAIGEDEIGSVEIGSGDDGSTPYFRVALPYDPDRFTTSKIRLAALGAGNLEVYRLTHRKVTHHGRRLPIQFRT